MADFKFIIVVNVLLYTWGFLKWLGANKKNVDLTFFVQIYSSKIYAIRMVPDENKRQRCKKHIHGTQCWLLISVSHLIEFYYRPQFVVVRTSKKQVIKKQRHSQCFCFFYCYLSGFVFTANTISADMSMSFDTDLSCTAFTLRLNLSLLHPEKTSALKTSIAYKYLIHVNLNTLLKNLSFTLSYLG